jgi:YfiH family protein
LIRLHSDGIVHYQFEALSTIPGLVHAVFTRLGGVSEPPYATLNLGHSVGDAPSAVEENQRRALAAVGLAAGIQVSPYQVHSARVEVVHASDSGAVLPATDGLVTRERGLPLLLRFADCASLFLYDAERQAIGLAHVGRRGLTAGTVQAAVARMTQQLGSKPARLWAGVGPAIGPCCYEVGPEEASKIELACPPGSKVTRRDGSHTYVDLPGAVEAQLRAAGVGHVENARLCTACHVDEFFSHRAEQGRTGRFGAVIGLADE